MSQAQFGHTSIVANGNGPLNSNDLLLVDAAINLANGHLNCDNGNRVGQSLSAAAAAALMTSSPPSSAHSDQHPGFPQTSDNKLSLMSSNSMNDSNNNSLGSNGSLSASGSNKQQQQQQLFGHLMNGGAGGGGGINMALGGSGQSLSDGLAGYSSGSPSPLMMKPPMNMQYYQMQWQQHQQQQQHHHQHRMQNSMSRGAISPNAAAALNGAGGESNYHFKTLVPAVAAGAIIGKGGETIAALQKETNARVKMSKSHDFYPGTMERICLITGSVESIMNVLDFIMEKIREKPDLSPKLTELEQKQSQERDKQVKILVPNSTAGMIIGKAGTYIKQIKEDSGSYVQISQKPKDVTLQERCITIIGERENNKVACKMILQKIVEDPQSGSLPNVSYADVSGPVANYNPIGSPYAMTQQNSMTVSSSTTSLNSALSTAATGASLLMNGSTVNLSLNLATPNPNPSNITQPIVDHLKMTMRRFGHPETATNEVSVALTLLAKYGVTISVPSHTNGSLSAASSLNYLGLSVDQSSAQAAANAAAASMAASNANNTLFSAMSQGNWESVNGATSPSLQSLERAWRT